jgi:RND family efflux transporter MFP subunit
LARLARPPGESRGSPTLEITAPVDGRLLRRGLRVGAVVSAASPEPAFRIARRGELEVEADIPETRIGSLAAGQAVRVVLPGAGEIAGRLRLVAPEIDRQTRLGRVRVAVPADARLRAGGTVSGAIETASRCGPAVPVSALLARPEGTAVQRVRDGRVETRGVTVGSVEGARAEVRDGLGEGDLVVARAGGFLRDGDRVRPSGPDAAPAGAGSELRR